MGSSAIDADGWLHTGDLAAQRPDGVVTLHGRLRDVIIRGGENIYPAEIEAVLLAHPAVADVAVVGAPDAALGRGARGRSSWPPGRLDPRRTGGVRPRAARRASRFPVGGTRWPRFPLTASGKVQKFRLVEQLDAS